MKKNIPLLLILFCNAVNAQTIIIDSLAFGVKTDIRNEFEILFPAKWDTVQKRPADLFRAIDDKNEKVNEASGHIAVRRFFPADDVANDSIINKHIQWYQDKFLSFKMIDSSLKINKNGLGYLTTTFSFRTNYYEKITLMLSFFSRKNQLYMLLNGGSKRVMKKNKKEFIIIIDNFKLL